MQQTTENNLVRLVGTAGRPYFSHESRGERFFLLPLTVTRLSGAEDLLPVTVRERQLRELELRDADKLCVTGELRSFNNRSGEGARLVLTVFARELGFCAEEDRNEICLRGTLCHPPRLRRTPSGRDICDLMLAVGRRCGRSDYLPCICWGFFAREAGGWEPGTSVALSGRVQSRLYRKMTAEGLLEKTAYEVSASRVERVEA